MKDIDISHGDLSVHQDKSPEPFSPSIGHTGVLNYEFHNQDPQDMQLDQLLTNANHFLASGLGSLPDYNFYTGIDIGIRLSTSATVSTNNKDDLENNLVSTRTEELNRFFNEELASYYKYIAGFQSIAEIRTKKAIELIAKLNYQNISLELTPSNSVFFNLLLGKIKYLHIEIFFDTNGYDEKEAFYSLIDNRKVIRRGAGSLNEVMLEVSQLVNL